MALLLTTTTLPGLLTKTSRFVTVDALDSVLKVKLVLQSAQHMPKQVKKNYTHRKLNTHKLNNQNAEKIVINRNEYSYILSIYTNDAKITRYSMSNNKV